MGASDALGAALSVSTSDYRNGGWDYTTTANSYAWYDGAVLDSYTYYKTNTLESTVDHVLTGSGQLASIGVVDSRPRTIAFTNDMNGQVLRRDEDDGIGANGDPHEIWYRFNGKQLGTIGNNGTLDTNYAMSVDNRVAVADTSSNGAFRNGAAGSTAARDFDQSLRPINSYAQGGAGGGYTVRAGDTLAGIAALLWGDANLWYKLAEANGLSGDTGLSEGRQLTVPSGITRNSHNASTFRAYDPSEMIGDTNPLGSPAPVPGTGARGNKCGAFGAILLTVVAVAVTALTAGTLTAAVGPVLGGVLSGAAGSIASQGVGLATGIQDKFSFKQVALAGLSGAVGGGLGTSGAFSGAGSKFAVGALRGAAGSALTQGVAVATGLQSKFDWAGVAAAGLGGGLSTLAGSRTGSLGRFGSSLAANTAGGIANAAVRTLASGGSFGDNLIRALPDVIGSTVGNALAGAMAGTRGGASNAAGSAPEAGAPVDAFGVPAGWRGGAKGGAWAALAGPDGLFGGSASTRWSRPADVAVPAQVLAGPPLDNEAFMYDDMVIVTGRPLPGQQLRGASDQIVTTGLIDSAYDSYLSGTSNWGNNPLTLVLDYQVGAAHSIASALVAIPSILADPGGTAIALGGRLDRLLMDNRSVFQAGNDLAQSASNLTLRQWARGAGALGGDIALGRYLPQVPGAVRTATGRLGRPLEIAAETVDNVIPTIGGRRPINSAYAGRVHPSGVRFTEQGFPDFAPHSAANVNLANLTGNYTRDAALANRAVGLNRTPTGYVWHHVEDGATMQLILRSVHNSVRHTGGAAVIRNRGFD